MSGAGPLTGGDPGTALDEQVRRLAAQERWPSHPSKSRSVARAIHLRLPVDARLWMRDRAFASVDRAVIARAPTGTPARDTAPAADDEPGFDV